EGEICDLEEPFDHFPFSKGIRHWIEKHNIYSTMEARIALAREGCGVRYSLKQALLSKDFNERRFHQKGLFLKLPGRPLLKFAYLMFWRRAFLDGRPGMTYALLQSVYEYFIILKQRELTSKSENCAGHRARVSSAKNELHPTEQCQPSAPLVEGVGRTT